MALGSTVHLVILVFAIVLSALAAARIGLPKVDFGWLAFCLFLISLLIR